MAGRNSGGGRRSAALAVLACLLVVGSALAVAPGTASAEHIDGEITYDGADGELTVDVNVREASSGGFTGNGTETVTIDVAGESFQRTKSAGGSSTYTYTIDRNELAGVLNRTNGADTRVSVSHGGGGSFNTTVDARYVKLDGTVGFTDGGSLRLGVGESFGIGPDGSVPIQVKTSDGTQNATATYEVRDAASLVIDRGTLGGLGILADPQGVTISGGEPYVRESAEINVGSAGREDTTGERLSSGGVRFTSPLFEDGRSYAVNVTNSSTKERYVRTLQANGRSISVDSGAVAAERGITLTVTDVETGSQVVTKRFTFDAGSLSGNASGTAVTFDSLPERASDGNATVWVQQGDGQGVDRYEARLDVENRTLESVTGSPSWPDADGTSLLISDANDSTFYATVSLQSGGGGGGGGSDGSSGSGLFAAVPRWVLFGAVIILGIGVVAGGVFAGLSMRDSSSAGASKQTSPGKSPGTATVDVTVEVFDEVAGTPYPDANRVVAQRANQTGSRGTQGGGFGAASNAGQSSGRDRNRSQGVNAGAAAGQTRNQGATAGSKRIDVVAGEGEAELEGGQWVFEVRQDGRTIGRRSHRVDPQYDNDRVVLSVDPYAVDVSVTDGPEREPLDGATVEATVDVGRWSGRKPTDAGGTVRFEVPRSATEAKFTAQHPSRSPVESTHRVERAAQNGVDLAIGAETGAMEIETVVGDRSWPGVDVRITPVGEEAKEYADEDTVTTNNEGGRRIEGVPAGEYEVSAEPTLPGVETTAAVESVRVTDGGTAEVALSIGVSYSTTPDQRERRSELRDRIEELTAATNRDVAIPRYYGTVLTSALGVIDELESTPERAVEMGIPPGETVTAVLDATEAGIRAVDGAMSERRNVKLFGDCASMPPAEVDWDGEATLDAFLDRVAEGGDHERRMLRDRLRETDEILDEKWGEVNEIAPARKLHDRLGELARETGGVDDELAVIAQTYVAICLLDAVGGIFDHDALVERLNSGSY